MILSAKAHQINRFELSDGAWRDAFHPDSALHGWKDCPIRLKPGETSLPFIAVTTDRLSNE